MTGTPDWIAWEERIAELLPGERGPSPDRALLLAELSLYAQAVVREARKAGSEAPTATERDQALEWLRRPVFICGHHRTGTTLLNDLLDGHPELVVLPNEATYFASFGYAARSRPSPQCVDRFVADWIARFVDPNYEPHFRLGRSGLAGSPSVLFSRRLLGWHTVLLKAWPSRAPFALLLSLVAAFSDLASASGSAGRRLWVEKTPRNEHHVDRFAVFRDARFIQLVRDPTATLASLLELHRASEVGEVDAAVQARNIARSLRLAQVNMRRLPERYLVVRYENLVRDPAGEMERVRIFLGISPNPALATPTVIGRPVGANSSYDPGEAGVIHRSRPTRGLSSAEATLIGTFAGSSARALGYDVAALPALGRAALLLREGVRYGSRRARARIARAFRRLLMQHAN
jgi:sulfotransferase family protein